MQQLGALLTSADVERRVARCMDRLLGASELPLNPFPTLAKLLRHEELAAALEQNETQSTTTARARLWREADLQTSRVDGQLALLPRHGAAWRPLAPLVDGEAIRALAAALAGSQLLAGATHTVSTPQGAFSTKSSCCLSGAHALASRLIAFPRTVEVREHVQVRGPGGQLDAALAAFAEHLCASALSVHASREHFVDSLEVYTGEDDAFDEEVRCGGRPEPRTTAPRHARPRRAAHDRAAPRTTAPRRDRISPAPRRDRISPARRPQRT